MLLTGWQSLRNRRLAGHPAPRATLPCGRGGLRGKPWSASLLPGGVSLLAQSRERTEHVGVKWSSVLLSPDGQVSAEVRGGPGPKDTKYIHITAFFQLERCL